MFFENLVAKSFKQLLFVIFIIIGGFHLRTCPIVNFELNLWNGIMNCTKFAFRKLEGQFSFGLTFDH